MIDTRDSAYFRYYFIPVFMYLEGITTPITYNNEINQQDVDDQ